MRKLKRNRLFLVVDNTRSPDPRTPGGMVKAQKLIFTQVIGLSA